MSRDIPIRARRDEHEPLGPAASPADRLRGYLMVASAAAGWGLSGPVLRAAERYQPVPAALEGAIVFGVAGLAFAPFAMAARARQPGLRPRSAWWGMAALGVSDALNTSLFFAAIQKTTLAIAVLTHYLAPVLVALASPLVLRERGSRSSWRALLLALLGLALLLEPWRDASDAKVGGALLGGASAVFFAANVLLSKKIQRHFVPLELLAYHAVIAALVLLTQVPRASFSMHPHALGILSAQGVVLTGLSGWIFLRGLARVPANHASILTLLEPVVAVALAALLWTEIPGVLGAIGGILILAGAYIVMRGGRAPRMVYTEQRT